MKCKDVIRKIEEKYPVSFAEEWDNPGLLVGDPKKEVKRVFLALDVTDESLEAAVKAGADMMITHHPLIFSGIKKVTADNFISRRIIGLIENGISYYAMHTNFDVLGMADLSADYLELKDREILEITYDRESRQEGLGRVGNLAEAQTLEAFGRFVKEKFQLPFVKVYGDLNKKVERVAVCTGSGKSLMPSVLHSQADVYVTADMDYHSSIDAVSQGICVIDAGHYGTEYIFMDYMEEELGQMLPELEVEKMRVQHPCKAI